MDADRFDTLAKHLAHSPSRRRVVRGLGGGLASAVLATLGGQGVEAAACRKPLTRCGKGKNATCANLQTDPNNCGTCGHVCSSGICANGSCQSLSCAPDSTCGQACSPNVDPNCSCGRTMANAPVCYDSFNANGCSGHSCATDTDCTADYGATSTCISGFCSTPGNYCNTDSECAAGYACVNNNDGCGGCDLFTGGQGICQRICTS